MLKRRIPVIALLKEKQVCTQSPIPSMLKIRELKLQVKENLYPTKLFMRLDVYFVPYVREMPTQVFTFIHIVLFLSGLHYGCKARSRQARPDSESDYFSL